MHVLMVEHLEAGLSNNVLTGIVLHRKECVVYHGDAAFAVNDHDGVGDAVDQVLTITVLVHAGGPSFIEADVYDLIIVAKQHNLGADGSNNLSQKITLFKHIRVRKQSRIFVFRYFPGNGRCGCTKGVSSGFSMVKGSREKDLNREGAPIR
jgi:hypothetical protein